MNIVPRILIRHIIEIPFLIAQDLGNRALVTMSRLDDLLRGRDFD